LHGVGVSCVNALSSDLRVEVHREGKVFEQEYKIGAPQYDVREIGTTDITGTFVTFFLMLQFLKILFIILIL